MALRTVMVVWIPHRVTGAERAPRHWKLLTAADPIIRYSGQVQNFYHGSATRNPFHRVISADFGSERSFLMGPGGSSQRSSGRLPR